MIAPRRKPQFYSGPFFASNSDRESSTKEDPPTIGKLASHLHGESFLELSPSSWTHLHSLNSSSNSTRTLATTLSEIPILQSFFLKAFPILHLATRPTCIAKTYRQQFRWRNSSTISSPAIRPFRLTSRLTC